MKTIRIVMDKELLRRLDETEEVQREGRSAVLRRATVEYLDRRRAALIRERYREAYGSVEKTDLGKEFGAWEDQGSWPEE